MDDNLEQEQVKEQADAEIHDSQEYANNDYVCPECGWTPKADAKNPERSLKGHMMRAHKVGWTPKKSREPIEKPSTPRPQTIEPREGEEVTIISEADKLREVLRLSRFKNAEMVVRLADTYGYDLYSIYNALREVSAPRSVIKPVLSWWSGYHNEPIPEEIANELGMVEYPSAQPRRYDRYGRRRPYERQRSDVDEKLDEALDRSTKIAMIKQLSSGEPSTESNGFQQPYEDPRIDFLTDENKKLKEKLEDEREKRYEAQRQADKAEFDAKLVKLETKTKDERVMILGKIDKTLERVGDVGERLVMTAVKSEFPEKPPKRQRPFKGKDTFAQLLPEEMLE